MWKEFLRILPAIKLFFLCIACRVDVGLMGLSEMVYTPCLMVVRLSGGLYNVRWPYRCLTFFGFYFRSPVFYIDATSKPSEESLRMFTAFFGARGCRIALAIGTCAVVERGAEAFTVGQCECHTICYACIVQYSPVHVSLLYHRSHACYRYM